MSSEFPIRFGGTAPAGKRGRNPNGRGRLIFTDYGTIIVHFRSNKSDWIWLILALVLLSFLGVIIVMLYLLTKNRPIEAMEIDPSQGNAVWDGSSQRLSLELADNKWMTFRIIDCGPAGAEGIETYLQAIFGDRLSKQEISVNNKPQVFIAMLLLLTLGLLVGLYFYYNW